MEYVTAEDLTRTGRVGFSLYGIVDLAISPVKEKMEKIGASVLVNNRECYSEVENKHKKKRMLIIDH